MKKVIAGLIFSGLISTLMGCGSSSSSDAPDLSTKVLLGKQLYSDKNLSLERTQSCATCHNPDQGFIDDRINDASRHGIASAGSLGDDQVSIGDRNAPSAGYAAFSREFELGSRARVESQKTSGIADYEGYLKGQFWDGRAATLAEQAGGPPLNPGEMNMPSKASVVERIKENSHYIKAFEELYSINIFDNVDDAYAAMTTAIEAFEETELFYPFDSKFDRSLTGEFTYEPLSKAKTGKTRFFSSDLTCASCHQLRPLNDKGEVFTSFEYHNIGVPVNTALRAINGVTDLDEGLLNNPAVNGDLAQKGKFKVPTLRNVAVTAPYMHNGIFNDLETVIHFYQHAKEKALNIKTGAPIELVHNPETNSPWGDAEINENIEHDLLGGNDVNLDEGEVDAMVCFLMSLTDKRYEHLLDQTKVENCGL